MNSFFVLGSLAAAICFFFMLHRKFTNQQDTKSSSSLSLHQSPPTSLSRNRKHHVFSSFHGADVRKTFLSHILESFQRKGINTFIDNDIERSKSIGPELVEAIRGSKIAIVLLSKNYASSSWCLDELVEIMECRQVFGQIVMTIFYQVDPTDIKKQSNDFGKAFRKTCKGKNKMHIKRWRKALIDVATREFQLGAIILDIRGTYPRQLCLVNEYNAQLQLQNKMLSEIINQKDLVISHLGVAQERLKDKKVLLVLVEVDHLEQLDALAKETGWFGPGSRVIITTENLRVLKAHGINHIYKVDFPTSDEAFQIFCMHAFGQKQPYDGFYELALEVVSLAGELPLGLKILGSALKGMSKEEWQRTLPRLKTRLNGEIESIIKFSYNALRDEEDKYLFLYIACLFVHKAVDKVEEVLANNFSSVRQGLHVLAQRSLISVNQFGNIEMHTLLQQFGKETSQKEFVHHGFAKRQLLFGERDICEVLNDDTIDSRRFIGIGLDLSKTNEELNISDKALERMHDFQFVRINNGKEYTARTDQRLQSILQGLINHSQKIRSLHWSWFQNICLPCSFNTEYLVELVMHHSRLHKLWEGTKPLRNLKWMNLKFSEDLGELPDLSTATNLEELLLEGCSSLVEVTSSIGKLTNLKILDFDYCSNLMKLPSSINGMNLKKLSVRSCSRLVKLPHIENASNLKELNIIGCLSLQEIPTCIETATNLQRLYIGSCSSLQEIPLSIGAVISLKTLELQQCSSLVKLPSTIGDLTNLETLHLSHCLSLLELPYYIGGLTNLRVFSLFDCSSLVKLPVSLENATNLQKLSISNCSSLVELPSIGHATKLIDLDLRNCSKLVKLPSSVNATNLKRLYLINCSSVVELPDIQNASKLRLLEIKSCSSLLELPPSIGTATKLKTLELQECSSLVKLPSSIGELTKLRVLNLSKCSSLVELPSSIGKLQQLYELKMCGCSKLEALNSNQH